MNRLFHLLLMVTCLAGADALSAPAPNPTPDSQGFNWDINNQGCVGSGTNYSMNNTPYISFSGNGFSIQAAPAEGDFLVYTGNNRYNQSTIQLTRRVRVDVKNAVAYWVDTLTNTSSYPLSTNLTYMCRLQSQGQGHYSDTGTPNPTSLGKKDTGIFIINYSNRPALLVSVLGSHSKLMPSIRNQSNYQYDISFPLSLAPGQTVSYALAMAQRNLSAPPAAKELRKLFRPLNLRYATKGLPAAVRKSLVNVKGGSDSTIGQGDPLAAMLDELGIERTNADILCLSESARINGTARLPSFKVATTYGAVTAEAKDIAAIRSLNRQEGTLEVHLRNGQVLAGRAELDKPISFETNFGSTIDLNPAFIRALIMREDSRESVERADVAGFLVTRAGDRFALGDQGDLKLDLALPWGEREVAFADLLSITRDLNAPMYGLIVHLQDGSHFRAYLGNPEMTFQTQAFGPVKIDRVNLFGLFRRPPKKIDDDLAGDDDLHVTNARLWGDSVLVGELDVDTVHFNNGGAIVEIPPSQLRTLSKDSAPDPERPREPHYFEGELWSGDNISGGIVEQLLPFRWGNTVLQIPTAYLMEYRVPAPTLPESLKVRIDRLVTDLGHEDWTVRDRATKSLVAFGAIAETYLSQALKLSSDPEVKRRLESILDELK